MKGFPPLTLGPRGLASHAWALVLALACGVTGGSAQEAGRLEVTSELPAVLDRDAGVVVAFNRAPVAPNERIAIYIDRTEVTALFRRGGDGRELRYEQGVVLLPEGEHELIVYVVNGTTGGWDEVGRSTFRTRGALGFYQSSADPNVTLGWETRLADGAEPETATQRRPDSDLDLQFRLSTEHVRDNLTISSEVSLVGTNRQSQALRFREEGEDAPKVDLSSYRLDAVGGPLSLSVGHVSAGNQKHLVNSFASRGATLAVRPSERVDLTFTAQNGSNEIGWDDLLGIDEGDHRVLSGSVGIEALPTPGALRVELTGMSGSILPRAGFNQGVVNDAERSRGLGVRVTANAVDRRLRLDAGWASSTFDNPEDPTLNQDFDVVAVEEESSSARYLEASFDAIRNLRLGSSRTVGLSFGARHERVDPLYRSLGAFVRADQEANTWDVRAELAGLRVQASMGESRNNLGEIVSILTNRTDRTSVNIGVPVARIVGRRASWLPEISLRRDRVHQFGEGIPENGGFTASHIPDQVSLNRSARADWRFSKVSFGVEWNRSEQDNRQEGRENADLNVTRRGGTIRFAPVRMLSVSVDLAHESSENVERDQTDETLRWGGQLQLQPFQRSSLSVRFSDTTTEDLLLTRGRANRQLNVQWSSMVPFMELAQGQYFLRWTRTMNSSFDTTFDRDDMRETWWLDLGLNFTLFNGGR
jgi:hypothetical protein